MGTVASVAGKLFARDEVQHFECEPEARGRLQKEAAPKFFSRKLIKREIAADGRKCLRILLQASVVEQLLREAPARQIIRAAVNLAQPAFVLPGAAADVDVPQRQLFQ